VASVEWLLLVVGCFTLCVQLGKLGLLIADRWACLLDGSYDVNGDRS